MDVQAVLFDFDGVLVDSEPENNRYLAQALAHHGVTLGDEDAMALVGHNSRDFLESLLSRAPEPVTVEAFLETRKRLGNFYENGEKFFLQPGARELLDALKRRNIPAGLVSSTRTQLIITGLNRLGIADRFSCIVCGDMVEKKKPAPDCYYKALGYLGVRAEGAVAIEDSPPGIQAAKAAGLRTIAYRGGHIRQDVSMADCSAESFSEILPLL